MPSRENGDIGFCLNIKSKISEPGKIILFDIEHAQERKKKRQVRMEKKVTRCQGFEEVNGKEEGEFGHKMTSYTHA